MSSQETAQAEQSSAEFNEERSYRYEWGITALLMLGYVLSFLDRDMLSLLITPIKESFELTDFQASLLLGPAFAIFYTVMGVPLGWAADRYTRTKLIAIGMTLWSIMTAFCGLSANFLQLFIARIGVGVGEASLTPSAVSLLSDYFPKNKLPVAMSIYSMGVFVGGGLAMVGGAYVLDALEGVTVTWPLVGTLEFWQLGFIIAGTPGILLALVIYCVKEPKRKEVALTEDGAAKEASFKEAFSYLWANKKLFLCFFLGGSLIASIGYNGMWYPEHFMRTFEWSRLNAGKASGYPQIIGGTTGLILGGIYMSYLIKKGQLDAPIRLAFYSAIGIGIPAVLMPLIPQAMVAAVVIVLIKFFVGIPLISGTTAIRMSVPNQMRGQFTAIYFVFIGLVATNIGPLMPGFITTFIFGDDPLMLKYSLAITASIVTPIGAILIWIGWQEYKKLIYAQKD